jgi:L-aspartate oxidase
VQGVESVDVLIIGSGIAGLSTALAINDREVMVLSAGNPSHDGSSFLAQGGMAAALGPQDNARQHANDTLVAGCGLADPEAVELLTQSAPDAIAWLQDIGVSFDHRQGRIHLGREAAHSRQRIVHAGGDATGKAVMTALGRAFFRAGQGVTIGNARAVSIGTHKGRACGAWVLTNDNKMRFIRSRHLVLACGGGAGLYQRSTNPPHAVGSGISLAGSCGARLQHLEFVQFHPTALDAAHQECALPLVTEALRGAGAHLIDAGGERFMRRYHPDAELAPRNVVASAIHQVQRLTGERVYLDATQSVGQSFPDRFPTVYGQCLELGIDATSQPIPVTPAAHYHMGGVTTDLWGRTSIDGLWACGEVACTGIHGANRLASNSLVEGVVFGRRVARAIGADQNRAIEGGCDRPPTVRAETGLAPAIRAAMWQHVGLERSIDSLREMLGLIENWRMQQPGTWEQMMLESATAITRAALARPISIGAHVIERPQSLAIA